MAEKMRAKNSFGEGLIMDFAPDNTSATVLTNALNATFLTQNGNEMSLQNDMGNARVESAFLPEGYVPVGTCEFGDIIYIVSYNPLINKSQIGCFPSPERNISNKEISDLSQTFRNEDFIQTTSQESSGIVKSSSVKKIIFGNKNIGAGDKFIISWGDTGVNNIDKISNFGNTKESLKENESYWPKLVKVHVVSIEDSGKITYLDNDVHWYDNKSADESSKRQGKFIISQEQFLDEDGDVSKDLHNLDEYRHALQCQYSIFQSKVSGKLALLLELETINNFSCGHKVFRKTEEDKEYYDIYFSAYWETDNYNINPCGMIITESSFNNMCIKNVEDSVNYLSVTSDTKYDADRMMEFTRLYKLEDPQNSYDKFIKNSYYTQVEKYLTFGSTKHSGVYSGIKNVEITKEETFDGPAIKKSRALAIPGSTGTQEVITPEVQSTSQDYYIYGPKVKNIIRAYKTEEDIKVPSTNDKGERLYIPNPEAYDKTTNSYYTTINGIQWECSPTVFSDDIVVNTFKKSILVKVATVEKILNEEDVQKNNEDYTITYTVCPCMPYGPLEHLAISNTIDFNKNLDGSVELDLWKYYVNAESVTLNFGFNTYLKEDEGEVIDKVIMEFYDNQGICATYELNNQESYDANFTEYIELDQIPSNFRMHNTRLAPEKVDRNKTIPIIHAGEYTGKLLKNTNPEELSNYVYLKDSKFVSASSLKEDSSIVQTNNRSRIASRQAPNFVELSVNKQNLCSGQTQINNMGSNQDVCTIITDYVHSNTDITKYWDGGAFSYDDNLLQYSPQEGYCIKTPDQRNFWYQIIGVDETFKECTKADGLDLKVEDKIIIFYFDSATIWYGVYEIISLSTEEYPDITVTDCLIDQNKFTIKYDSEDTSNITVNCVKDDNTDINVQLNSTKKEFVVDTEETGQGVYTIQIIATNNDCYETTMTGQVEITSSSTGGDTPGGDDPGLESLPIIKFFPEESTFNAATDIQISIDKNGYNKDYVVKYSQTNQLGVTTFGTLDLTGGDITLTESCVITVTIMDEGNNTPLVTASKNYDIITSDIPLYPNDAGILYYGRPYLVKIKIYKGRVDEVGNIDTDLYKEPLEHTRWLWTAPVFNDYYTSYNDFKDCQLRVGLDFQAQFDGTILHKNKYSKFSVPICIADKSYDTNHTFDPKDSIGMNINQINKEGDSNITFAGIPELSESYGNSLFLDPSAYETMDVTIGTTNPRVLIGDTSIIYEDTNLGAIEGMLPLAGDPSKFDPQEFDSNSVKASEAKDNFTLKFTHDIETSQKYSYYDSQGNYQINNCDVFTITAKQWLPWDPKNNPKLCLQGIKYNRIGAGQRQLLESSLEIVPILNSESDLLQYGLKLSESSETKGQPYYEKIPYLGFSERKGSGTQTKVTCGYLLYSENNEYPQLYITYSKHVDGNPLKANFENEALAPFIQTLETYPLQQIILGRGMRIDGNGDGVDGAKTLDPRPTTLTQKMGGDLGDCVTRWVTGDRPFYPYPDNLATIKSEIIQVSNPDGTTREVEETTYNRVNNDTLVDADNGPLVTIEQGGKYIPFVKHDNPNAKTNYIYTLLGLYTPDGFYGTADGGILKIESGTLSQNFDWRASAKDYEKSARNYAQVVASLLSQLYVLKDSEVPKSILTNIAKLKDYNEQWKADILVNLHQKIEENDHSSKYIGILPKILNIPTDNSGMINYGINLFTYALSTQIQAGVIDSSEFTQDTNSSDIVFIDANNIDPEFTDLLKCIEFVYDLPYDLGTIIQNYYSGQTSAQVFKENIVAHDWNPNSEIPSLNITQTLQPETLYVYESGRFIPFSDGSKFKLIDHFNIYGENDSGIINTGKLVGVKTSSNHPLDINKTSHLSKAMIFDGASLIIKNMNEFSRVDSQYRWVLYTHGDDPELRDLKRINIFNYGKLV